MNSSRLQKVEWDESLSNVKISGVYWEGKYTLESNNLHDNFYIIIIYFLQIKIIHFPYISLKHEIMNSYINVPFPYRSCLSSIITAKIKFLAISLNAVKKKAVLFFLLYSQENKTFRSTVIHPGMPIPLLTFIAKARHFK